MTDWEARVAKAKRDGGWHGPDEEPGPYPPRIKRLRFWTAFASTLAAMVVLGVLLHLLSGHSGSPISSDVLLDGLFRGLFPAFFIGWTFTRPPRRKQPRTR